MRKKTSSYAVVKYSDIHHRGVFAKKDILEGTKIIEYVGKKVSRKKSDAIYDNHFNMAQKNAKNGQVYLFELNSKFDIDGNVPQNTAKYINHSCDPNCETDIINGRIWIIALRDIKVGEELYYDYAISFDTDFEDHPCHCGSEKCVGYIVSQDDWPKLKSMMKKKKLLY